MKKLLFALALLFPFQAHALTHLIDCSNDGDHALTSTSNPEAFRCTTITGGGGLVTSITGDGTLISNVVSSGAVTLTIANATAKSLWGNPSSSSAAPGYTTAPIVSGLMTAAGFAPTDSTATGNRLYLPALNTPSISANGIRVASFETIASGVDYFDITPGATGNPATITIAAAGSDSNIKIALTPKGTGSVDIPLGTGITVAGNNLIRYPTNSIGSIAVGYGSLAANTSTGGGISNTAVGFGSLFSFIASGGPTEDNTAVGGAALITLVSGIKNTAVGGGSLFVATGNANTALGWASGGALTSGSNNTFIGNAVGNTTLTTGLNNVLIGVDASCDTAAGSTSNTLKICGVSGGTPTLSATGTNGTPTITLGGPTTAPSFSGPLTGNVTGNVSGSSGSTTGNAATATALQNARTIGGTSFDGTANIAVALSTAATTGTTVAVSNSASYFPIFAASSTNSNQPFNLDSTFTYNPSTDTLTAATFVGALTGNVTGNASGTAATVTGATQAAITSAANLATVGTITSGVWNAGAVTSSGAMVGASTITLGTASGTTGSISLKGTTSGTAIITPQAAAGTPTITLGTSSGTPAVTASSPLGITTATGNITCATCGVTGTDLGQFAATSSSTLRGVISDENGTGVALFNSATSPTFVTGATVPLVIGGTTASSSLTLKSTSGVGTSDSILFKTGDNGGTTAMTIATGGLIGIGVAPGATYALDIQHTTAGSNIMNVQNNAADGFSDIDFHNNSGTYTAYFGWGNASSAFANQAYWGTASTNPIVFYPNNTEALRIASGGIVTFAAGMVNSHLAADTATTDNSVCVKTSDGTFLKGSGTLGICLGTSSARYKNNIRPLKAGINEIIQLKPKAFFYNKGHGDDGAREQYGLLAEDAIRIVPKLVGLDREKKPNSVDLLGLVPVMINAIQQLKYANDNLQHEVETLRKRIK